MRTISYRPFGTLCSIYFLLLFCLLPVALFMSTTSPCLGSPCTSSRDIIWTLRSNDADGNGNVNKTIGLMSKTTTSHVHHTFLYISVPFLLDYDMKLPISRFLEDVNKQRRNFISLSGPGYGRLKFSFRRVRLHLTK